MNHKHEPSQDFCCAECTELYTSIRRRWLQAHRRLQEELRRREQLLVVEVEQYLQEQS